MLQGKRFAKYNDNDLKRNEAFVSINECCNRLFETFGYQKLKKLLRWSSKIL